VQFIVYFLLNLSCCSVCYCDRSVILLSCEKESITANLLQIGLLANLYQSAATIARIYSIAHFLINRDLWDKASKFY